MRRGDTEHRLAHDAANKLDVSYPATIGSTDTPSPSGKHLISRVVLDPNTWLLMEADFGPR